MKKYLSQTIGNNENGLYICRLPTGYGKSYAVDEVIKEMLSDPSDTRKIFYLTSLKKNLPKELENSPDTLVLRSNLDQITEMLPDLEIPDLFRTAAYYRTLELAERLTELREKGSQFKEQIKFVENELRESERCFRHELQDHLKKRFHSKELRLNAIKKENTYRWIGELYPAVFTDEKRVLIMTMKIFLGKNSVIIDRSYDFITSDLLKDAVVFIDEFDATKSVIMEHIIERALGVSNDYLNLFGVILNGLTIEKMSADLQKALSTQNRVNKGLTELIKTGNEYINEFKLDYSCKMSSESIDRHQNFLFNDGSFHTVLEKGKQYISMQIHVLISGITKKQGQL